jgi:tripartite-type tricarboxylate transporter receptor subunit TctC
MRVFSALLLIAATSAFAQSWPAKPIKIVVPFAPGGNVDITARLVAPGLQELLGQPVVIENKPGAGGTIGADLVAKAAPDGYTLLMGSNSTFSVAPSLYPKNPYHPIRDFSPVIAIAATPFILVVNPTGPKTAKELVDRAKASPGKTTMASAGTGSSNHLLGELFQEIAGVRFTHVPYKGSSQALQDLMGGQVDLHFDQVTSAGNHVTAGKLRALMVTQPKRAALLPDVPTSEEAGYPAFQATNVTGLMAPAGTPRDIIDKVNAATRKILERPAILERLAQIGADSIADTPEKFGAYIQEDFAKWTRIVREANVKVD